MTDIVNELRDIAEKIGNIGGGSGSSSGGGENSAVMIVNFTNIDETGENPQYVADKTLGELNTHVNNGGIAFACVDGYRWYMPVSCDSSNSIYEFKSGIYYDYGLSDLAVPYVAYLFNDRTMTVNINVGVTALSLIGSSDAV